jgi:hypothetical protein
MSGLTAAQVWHHDALQKVIRLRFEAALRSVRVWRSLGCRMGSKMRFWYEGVGVGLKREMARWVDFWSVFERVGRWRVGRIILGELEMGWCGGFLDVA